MGKTLKHQIGKFTSIKFALTIGFIGLAGFSTSLRAEIIYLNDGTTISGTVKKTDEGYEVKDSATGKSRTIPTSDVKRIEISAESKGPVEANSRLQSLRRSVENISDIKSILEKYARFIDQFKDSPVAKEAERDREMWKERLEKNMVKVGTQWVTAEDRTKLIGQSSLKATQARDLILAGRGRDADTLLDEVFLVDPKNPSANYLKAVQLSKQDQFPQARKIMEGVVAAVNDHGPSWNNLAVLEYRGSLQTIAMGHYAQAMLNTPVNRQILDNVTEALHAVPDRDKKNAMVIKAQRLYDEQEPALEAKQAKLGLSRWGSSWVPKEDVAKLKAIEADVQKKIAELTGKFEEITKRIATIETEVTSNAKRMQSMESSSYAKDEKGNIYRIPLPSRYYELQTENKDLAAERDKLSGKQAEMRATANTIQQQIPKPKFKGTQTLMGAEFTVSLPQLPDPSDPKPAPTGITIPKNTKTLIPGPGATGKTETPPTKPSGTTTVEIGPGVPKP